ncbi:MAG TPA: putative lipid II flippase FtsW [Bacteriovoracaceae bacterium]|nr:putative lipid II flippase FtsW [Bacteriovoracaceae bacterium]
MNEANSRLEKLTNYFLINVFFLVLFGVIMVFSASYMYAKENMGSSYFFLSKQLIYIALGLALAMIFSRLKILYLYKQAYKLNALFCFLITLTLIPGLSVVIKGSRRWLNLGFMNLQPGEFMKFSLMLAAIRYFENFNNYTSKQRLLYLTGLVYPLAILILQPDFGTFFISSMIIGFIAFLSSFPRKYFYSTLVLGLIGAFGIMISAPYRVKRVLTFLDPWADPRGSGFQIIQSFLAFANGAFFGQGLGNSNEKLFYLPEAYNDFIFSVIGEELGFIGVLATAIMFVSFIFIGLKMAITLKSRVGSILVSTVIFAIGLQAFLNMGVVLGVLPTKGLNLPFVSYGGSSMVANLAALGLVMACIKIQPGDAKEVKSKGKQTPIGSLKSAFQ